MAQTLAQPTLLAAQVSAAAGRATSGTTRVSARRGLTAGDLRRVAAAARVERAETGHPTATAAAAGLALLTKLGEYLLGDDSSGFLSFPAVAVPADPPGSFGLVQTVSIIPRHAAIWRPPVRLTMLWEAWRQVMDEAVVTNPDPTPAEQEQVQSARRLIFDDVELGTPSSTYQRYRDLLEEYLDAAAAAAEDELSATDEPVTAGPGASSASIAARTQVEAAARRLAVEGRRAEVEAALDVIARFGLSQPTVMWNDARQAFHVLTAWSSDPGSGTEYPDTSWLPRLFEEAAWTPIELDAAEIASLSRLAAQRYPELVDSHLFDDRVADEGGQLHVTGLRAELTQLRIQRDWFRPDILATRSWRLRDPAAEPLSDGGQPATGRLPAFVTSIAVLRNLEIDRVRFGPAPPQVVIAAGRLARTTSALARLRQRLTTGPVVRDHRSAADSTRVRDHRGQSVPDRPQWPTEHVPISPTPVEPHREESPRIAAFMCQLVPLCPDPDPGLFPELVKEAPS